MILFRGTETQRLFDQPRSFSEGVESLKSRMPGTRESFKRNQAEILKNALANKEFSVLPHWGFAMHLKEQDVHGNIFTRLERRVCFLAHWVTSETPFPWEGRKDEVRKARDELVMLLLFFGTKERKIKTLPFATEYMHEDFDVNGIRFDLRSSRIESGIGMEDINYLCTDFLLSIAFKQSHRIRMTDIGQLQIRDEVERHARESIIAAFTDLDMQEYPDLEFDTEL